MLSQALAIGLLVFLGFVFSIVVHECAHAIVASWCGDDTARLLGRITLNPIPHIDLFMSIIVPLSMLVMSGGSMVFGGAKPVPVNVYRLRHPRRDMMWVALAGPISNVILAILFALAGNLLWFAFRANHDFGKDLRDALAGVVFMNMLLACFNMIPVPPLDGSRVLAYFLPSNMAQTFAQVERFGLVIVVMLMYSGVLRPLLKPAIIATSWLIQHLIVTVTVV
jgi:Zn-dependent protease